VHGAQRPPHALPHARCGSVCRLEPLCAALRQPRRLRGRLQRPRRRRLPQTASSQQPPVKTRTAAPALRCRCAAYTPAVDADAVSSVAQNAIGVLFTIAFAAFLLRVLRKRASRALNVRVAAERKAVDAPPAAELPPVTAVACFQGAGLAVLCAAALWTFTQFVEGAFDSAAPSDQYAVRNVTGTLRSIVTGLGYLATFLFGANAIGLSGLGLQIATGGQQAAEEKAADDDRAP